MVRHRRTLAMISLCCGLTCAASQGADRSKSKEAPSTVDVANIQPGSPNIETIMEVAVQNIARRYNLNDEQTRKTHELMSRGVHEFLREHEDQIFPVIRDLLDGQLKPPAKIDDAKRLGKAALPLARLAKESIFQYNLEWREILYPDQLATHDYDMREMETTFAQIEQNLHDWQMGRPSAGPFIPPPNIDGSPPIPKRPPPGLPDPVEEGDVINLLLFDMRVREFIREYNLDEGQRDAARSICDEYKARAVDFRTSNKQKLGDTNKNLEAATAAGDQKKIRALEAERRRILAPYNALFSQMDGRLHDLLTTSQKQRQASPAAAKPGKPAKPAETKAPAKDRSNQPKRVQTPKKKPPAKPATKPAADSKPEKQRPDSGKK